MSRFYQYIEVGRSHLEVYRSQLLRIIEYTSYQYLAAYIGHSIHNGYQDKIDDADRAIEEAINDDDELPLLSIIERGKRIEEVTSMMESINLSTRSRRLYSEQELIDIIRSGQPLPSAFSDEPINPMVPQLSLLDNILILLPNQVMKDYAIAGYEELGEAQVRNIPNEVSLQSVAHILVYIGFLLDRNPEICHRLSRILTDAISTTLSTRDMVIVSRIILLADEVATILTNEVIDVNDSTIIRLATPHLRSLRRDRITSDKLAGLLYINHVLYQGIDNDRIVIYMEIGNMMLGPEWVNTIYVESSLEVARNIMTYIGFLANRDELVIKSINLIKDSLSLPTGTDTSVLDRVSQLGSQIATLVKENVEEDEIARRLPVLDLQLPRQPQQPSIDIIGGIPKLLTSETIRKYAEDGYYKLGDDFSHIIFNRLSGYILTDILVYVGFLIGYKPLESIIELIIEASRISNATNDNILRRISYLGRQVITMINIDSYGEFDRLINPNIDELLTEYNLSNKLISMVDITSRRYIEDGVKELEDYVVNMLRSVLQVILPNTDLKPLFNIVAYIGYLHKRDNPNYKEIFDLVSDIALNRDSNEDPNILIHIADLGEQVISGRVTELPSADELRNLPHQPLHHTSVTSIQAQHEDSSIDRIIERVPLILVRLYRR